MKTFTTFRAAAANGSPVLRIGLGRDALFVVGFDDPATGRLVEVALIVPKHGVAGCITLGNLDRLGNGNVAVATHPIPTISAFEPESVA